MTFLQGWTNRKSKQINGTTTSLINYQIKILIAKGDGVDTNNTIYVGNNVLDNFGDIRFTKNDGITPLDYWIETIFPGTLAIIWVEIDQIPISPLSTQIYVYFNNPDAVSISNGYNTFDVFDDFNINHTTFMYDNLKNDINKEGWNWVTTTGNSHTGIINSINFGTNSRKVGYANGNEYYNVLKEAYFYRNVNIDKAILRFAGYWGGSRSGIDIVRVYLGNSYIDVTPSGVKILEVTNLNTGLFDIKIYTKSGASYGGGIIEVAWIAIRKYASIEPIYGISGSIESDCTDPLCGFNLIT